MRTTAIDRREVIAYIISTTKGDTCVGTDSDQAILRAAISLLNISEEKHINIHVGGVTVEVERRNGATIAIVFITGDNFAKSAKRSMDRVFKSIDKTPAPAIAAPLATMPGTL